MVGNEEMIVAALNEILSLEDYSCLTADSVKRAEEISGGRSETSHSKETRRHGLL
jgi:hypothetical protein